MFGCNITAWLIYFFKDLFILVSIMYPRVETLTRTQQCWIELNEIVYVRIPHQNQYDCSNSKWAFNWFLCSKLHTNVHNIFYTYERQYFHQIQSMLFTRLYLYAATVLRAGVYRVVTERALMLIMFSSSKEGMTWLENIRITKEIV